MASRMDRYKDPNNSRELSRSVKNKELYENIGSNTRYTNITDVTNANAYEINDINTQVTTREGYHRVKEYAIPSIPKKEKKDLENFKYLYQDRENRIYDINRVLEDAHKNRTTNDGKEEKRKLKDESYNILTSLSKEDLEKYQKERISRAFKNDEKEIKELINTITSKTLAGEISRQTSVDLLSELMATNVLDKVEGQKETPPIKENDLSLSKEVLDKEQLEKIKAVKEKKEQEDTGSLKGADNDFYTRSMDLSDKDFEMDDEFAEKKVPVAFKIIAIIVFILALAAAAYFIWKNTR